MAEPPNLLHSLLRQLCWQMEIRSNHSFGRSLYGGCARRCGIRRSSCSPCFGGSARRCGSRHDSCICFSRGCAHTHACASSFSAHVLSAVPTVSTSRAEGALKDLRNSRAGLLRNRSGASVSMSGAGFVATGVWSTVGMSSEPSPRMGKDNVVIEPRRQQEGASRLALKNFQFFELCSCCFCTK